MASSKSFLVPALLLVLVVLMSSNSFVIGSTTKAPPLLKICRFNAMYQLGDSFSDTGNQIRESSNSSTSAAAACGCLPYSSSFVQETYDTGTPINTVTGRCSDGFLITDYLAMFSGVNTLEPYKNREADFSSGVNFAVSGATALPLEVLASKHNVSSPITNSSLNIQLDWMSSHFNSTCGLDCVEKLENTLFMVGEIGGNDYKYAIFQGKTVDEVKSMVPEVVDAIISAVRKLMSFGATRIVVPGQLPIGCLPIYQTAFQTNIFTAYDEHKCLKSLNEFATYHNEKLQQAIDKLKQVEKPNAIIVYSDYYNAYKSLLKFATSNGFETEKACCGTGGKYNFDTTRMCGAPDVGYCPDPYKYINWDGVHLTMKANEIMSDWLCHDYFKKFNCRD